jgi:uncharacterized protein (DUF58 family)
MHPSLRTMILLAAGIPLSVAAILIDERLWIVGLAYLSSVILLMFIDALMTPLWHSFGFEYQAPNLAFIGDSEDLIVSVVAPHTKRETLLHILCDLDGDIAPVPSQKIILPPEESRNIHIDLNALRRGTITIERLWFRWNSPMKLMTRTKRVKIDHSVSIVPNVRAVRRNAIKFFSRDSFFGMKSQTQQGIGSEFSALREYVPGLDHRSIDWKHSARHRDLVCKEFETERNHQIIIAFDTGHLMSEPVDGIPKLDHAINAGLLIAYVSLRFGDRVGFFGFDESVRLYAEPVSGTNGFQLLQKVSAEFDYQLEETNFTLGLADLMGRLNRRSLIIILTDFVDTTTAELMIESVGRLSKRHFVLFVSIQDLALHGMIDTPPESTLDVAKAVVADDILKERQLVFEKIRRLGAHCLEAPSNLIGVDLVNQYMAIKRRELI